MLDAVYADLTRPLRLNELAELADLSPFHFHRVFQAMVGETPSEFVKRLRLERSLHLMSYGKRSSLTDIALNCGFSSSSDFTRSFKQRFGVAPSRFDLAAWHAKHGELSDVAKTDKPTRLDKPRSRANPDQFQVRIRNLPPRTVAYIRVSNPYQGDSVVQAANRLMAWAERRMLADGQWLGYQYENPQVTALESCHYCVAVEIESTFLGEGEIGVYRFPSMQVAEVEMKGDIDREIRLLQWLYGSWLPRSKYEPADQPCFEAWEGKPFEQGLTHFELSIQLPVKS